MSLVIVGTDTEVGKTVVSALLMARYGRPLGLRYWKPLATGSKDERDVETVETLCPEAAVLPESYLYSEPLSPHLAARLEGDRIDPRVVVDDYRRHRDAGGPMVVEGVGGVLVPLVDGGPLLIDLLVDLALPTLVVTRSTLGTINHSLLTFEALRHRDLTPVGAVMVGPSNVENRNAIEQWGNVPVVGELPWLEPLDAARVRQAADTFDREEALRPWLDGSALATGSPGGLS